MEHSLHLAAKHFVQTIGPPSSKNLATLGADSDGEAALDDDNDDEDDDEDLDLNTGDSLAKAIALVKQVCFLCYCINAFTYACLQIRKSPQARTFFRTTCVQVNIKPLELLLWIRTRWGSLFKFLERFLHLQAVRILFLLHSTSNPLLPGRHSIYSSCGRKRRLARPLKPPQLCRLPPWSARMGPPRAHQGCAEGAIQRAANLLE